MAGLETLIFDIVARDRASEGLSRAGQSAKDAGVNVGELSRKLTEVGSKSATARVGLLGDKESQAALDKLDAKLLGLDKRTSSPKLTLEGAAKANAEISSLSLELDKLGRKDVKPKVTLTDKITKAGILQPSLGGALAGLSPAVIPVLGAAAAAVGSLAISFSGAAIGAGAFGLLAKQALTGAGTAAGAVQKAQEQYSASIAAGTSKATAYRAEQKAIGLAYAQMTPQQIALSKAVGGLQDAWRGVQQSTTPLISGALVPWIKAVESLMKDIRPAITPVADIFKAWGQAISTYFASHQGSDEIHRMAVNFGQFSASQLASVGTFIFDIGKGIFNLGKDLVSAGGNISAAGNWLSGMGQGFASWSQSGKARADVQGFLHYLHTEGPVVTGILKDIGKLLPGIFAGASSAGQLELKALSDFLGFVTRLPKDWQKPLTAAAGALFLLAKTGVIKAGINIVGTAAGLVKKLLGGVSVDLGGDAAASAMRAAFASGGADAAAMMREALAGGAVAGDAGVAGGDIAGAAASRGIGRRALGVAAPVGLGVLGTATVVAPLLQGASSGHGGNWWDNPAGGANPSDKGKGGPPNALSSWDQLGHDIEHDWSMVWTNTYDRMLHGFHDIAHGFDDFRHDISSVYDSIGHAISIAWNTAWNNTIARLNRGKHDVAHGFDDLRHSTADVFDGVRHDVASAWNTTWNNTISRLTRGVHDAGGWFSNMRHDTANVFDGIRHDIASAWNTIWNNTVSRVQNGISAVIGFFRDLPGRAVSALAGLGTKLYNLGHTWLTDLFSGIKSVWKSVTSWFSSLPGDILHAIGIHSPPDWAIAAGKHIMNGLHLGMSGTLHKLLGFGGTIGSLVTKSVGSIGSLLGFGGGSFSGIASVGRWSADVLKVLKMLGLPASYLGPWLRQMQTESSGNPIAINLTDSNAAAGDPSRGLLQTIAGTFNAYAGPYRDLGIYNPLANIYAGINYALHQYGRVGMLGVIGHGHGYAAGTSSARPGWAWVGERGPELMRFRGGEQVIPAGRSHTGSGGVNGPLVHVAGNLVVREQADAVKLAAQIDFRIKSSWMG